MGEIVPSQEHNKLTSIDMVELGEALQIDIEESQIVEQDLGVDPTLTRVVNPKLVNQLLENQ